MLELIFFCVVVLPSVSAPTGSTSPTQTHLHQWGESTHPYFQLAAFMLFFYPLFLNFYIFVPFFIPKNGEFPAGLLFCCCSPSQRRCNPNVFVREQNGFGRNKGGIIWITFGVYSNLFYRMPGWMIVVLNEQLFTLIHLVWSGSQCWPSSNQQTGRWRGWNNPLSTLSIVLVLPASLWCLLGIQPICDLMMHQINTGRRHSGSLGNLFWVIY